MDEKKLNALATGLAKSLKTEADFNAFSRMPTGLTVETALNAELTDHPGHEKNVPKSGLNTRNGYSSKSSKTLLCDDDEIELSTSRDRENTFEPQLIKKNQTRITQMTSSYPVRQSMTTREIVSTFKEMYDADMSPTLISKVTDAVKDSVRKVIYLTIKDSSKKRSMPIKNWRLAISRFIIQFGDWLNDHLYQDDSHTELGTRSKRRRLLNFWLKNCVIKVSNRQTRIVRSLNLQ